MPRAQQSFIAIAASHLQGALFCIICALFSGYGEVLIEGVCKDDGSALLHYFDRKTEEERADVAGACVRKLAIKLPAVLDEFGNSTEQDLPQPHNVCVP